ncbi:MAG TPA: DUF262 domain-containing protein, partial [Candidatus Babeliaceae bacterium]|nr:DUF262 domain-containing protein [Candidatus Babeliaceae bacterium]
MKAPELTPSAEKIDKLIGRVNSGDIRIPAFQRGYVWKSNQILDLLDSIVKNYPIGSILLWSTHDKLNHTRNIAGYKIPESSPEYPVNYVLDGQQRLSSIFATFSGQAEQDATSEKYNPELDIFEIYYDFENKNFSQKNEISPDPYKHIYLRDFLDGAKLIDALSNLDKQYHVAAKDLYSKFINYELPVVTIKNRTKSEVGIIFERINNTGTKLSTLDLMTAWTWTDDFHLLDSIKELLDELEDKNFGNISRNVLLQAISGVIQDDTTTQAILSLDGQQVRNQWDSFCEAIRKSIDFLCTDVQCMHQDFLPAQQQLVSLCKFFSWSDRPTHEQLNTLKKWFWKTAFSTRYSTGQTTTKMNSDIETINEIRKNNFKIIDTIKPTISESDLINSTFTKSHVFTRAFLLLMAQFAPNDLIKNVRIDLTKALSNFNRKEYHHIFPRSFLENQGIAKEKISSLMNFCFLSSDSNKKISKQKPSDYFFNLIPDQHFVAILTNNLIPVRKEIFQRDDYNSFLQKR